MDVNRIIVWTNPTAPFQKIYVMKDGVLVDQFGVKFEDVKDITYAVADKYDINDVHFSGTRSYAEKIVQEIMATQYENRQLNIEFV